MVDFFEEEDVLEEQPLDQDSSEESEDEDEELDTSPVIFERLTHHEDNIATQITDDVVVPVQGRFDGTAVMCGTPVGWKPPSAPDGWEPIAAKGKIPEFSRLDNPGE